MKKQLKKVQLFVEEIEKWIAPQGGGFGPSGNSNPGKEVSNGDSCSQAQLFNVVTHRPSYVHPC